MIKTKTLVSATTALFHITPTSSNAKTGKILVTTSTAFTCPEACPFRHDRAGGCYAGNPTKGGAPLALHWKEVTEGRRGAPWISFLADLREALDAKGRGALWRHNQAGDLPGRGNVVDGKALAQLVDVNVATRTRGFTYTHKPLLAVDADGDALLADLNLAHVVDANARGFTVNASANNLAHVDALKREVGDLVPVVVVLPADAPLTSTTPDGHKVVVCPAQRRDDVTCATCGLCARADRSVVVGFLAHGAQARKATEVARG
jgi:hypothetical protein